MYYLKKTLLLFTLEKNNLLYKREKNITCREKKSQPPLISNCPSLTYDRMNTVIDKSYKTVRLYLHTVRLYTHLCV